jgi:hypothetical protein
MTAILVASFLLRCAAMFMMGLCIGVVMSWLQPPVGLVVAACLGGFAILTFGLMLTEEQP